MENAIKVAEVAAPLYLILGLSILLYAKPWQDLMKKWQKDHLLLFPLMFFYPILGVIVINMYNVWEWNQWLIVTLIGWILLIKGALYFLLPGSVLKSLMEMKNNIGLLYFGGVVALAIGGVLGYYAYYV